jgi:predicted glycogen debranching enzyme
VEIKRNLQTLDDLSSLEWIETNGLGSFAFGTVSGAHTRRYHGLFLGALHPPGDRILLLSKLEERLYFDGQAPVDLATNYYPGVTYPSGYQLISYFNTFPCITWHFSKNNWKIQKQICMIQGRQGVLVRYELLEGEAAVFSLAPLLAYRNYNSLVRENSYINHTISNPEPGIFVLNPYENMPELVFAIPPNAQFSSSLDWFRNFQYRVEKARGFDFQEDLYNPGMISLRLTPKMPFTLWVGLEKFSSQLPEEAFQNEIQERMNKNRSYPLPEMARALSITGEKFLIRRQDGTPSILAGFPWFEDWGRDCFISLPGLLIETGKTRQACDILKSWIQYLKNGLLPNRFPDAGDQAEYNSADAIFWYIWALSKYVLASNDTQTLKGILPKIQNALKILIQGTIHGIHVDLNDGLIFSGELGFQLTWMDAKIGNNVITPRMGKPIEINALWIYALDFLNQMFPNDSVSIELRPILDLAKNNFFKKFWNESKGYFNDVIDGPQGAETNLRPNQIIGLALVHEILVPEKAKLALKQCQEQLLTPFGLRTLSPQDPKFHSKYQGNSLERDSAYHQGTVWPWLLGFYGESLLKFGEQNKISEFKQLILNLQQHLQEFGIDGISEVFDATVPFLPGGCPFQAWSVAEVFRIGKILNLW